MQLLIATHNRGKLIEYQELLAGLGLELMTLDDVGIKDDVEPVSDRGQLETPSDHPTGNSSTILLPVRHSNQRQLSSSSRLALEKRHGRFQRGLSLQGLDI